MPWAGCFNGFVRAATKAKINPPTADRRVALPIAARWGRKLLYGLDSAFAAGA